MGVEEYRLGQEEGLHISSRGFLQGPGVRSIHSPSWPFKVPPLRRTQGQNGASQKDLPQMEQAHVFHLRLRHRVSDFDGEGILLYLTFRPLSIL